VRCWRGPLETVCEGPHNKAEGATQPCLQVKDRGDRSYKARKMFSHSHKDVGIVAL